MNKNDEILKFFYDTLHRDFAAIEQAFLYFYADKLTKEEFNLFLINHNEIDRKYRILYGDIHDERQRIIKEKIGEEIPKEEWDIRPEIRIENRKKYEKLIKNRERQLIKQFDQVIGPILAEECRLAESCPMKALLPEYKETKRKQESTEQF